MNPELGLQLWSVRNSLQKDYAHTLEKVAEVGYRNLELICNPTPAGLVFGEDLQAEDLRKLLDKNGLRAVSCHFVPTPDMGFEAILDDLHVLGVDSLACAIAFFKDAPEVLEFCAQINRLAETSRKAGVQFYYHNHYEEFQVFGEYSVYERLIKLLDKDLVKFEFDTYWATRGGQDPIYWLKKLGTRCDLVHQKDLPADLKQVNLLQRFGYDSVVNLDTIMVTQDPNDYTEVGDGILNIPGFIEAARKYNHARYIFIEQDMTKKTELESIAVSFDRMTRLLA